MLQGDLLEGKTLRFTSSVEVLPEDDPSAVLHLMDIIHGRTRRVPRLVDLRTLTQLTVLVNYYQFHEAVKVFSDMWLDALRSNCLDLTQRIFLYDGFAFLGSFENQMSSDK